MSHSINNYINVNINNNNNINVNINNVNCQNNGFKNKQISLNQVLMSLIKSNNKKYQNSKDKVRNENKNTDSFFDNLKNAKSRNINQKTGLCHVKSMDYNNKPLNTDLMGTENNTFYDKTFNNNIINKRINNNMKINISTQGNKLNWNYSYLKMRKENTKKNNISFKPIKNETGIISRNAIKKFNLKNNNYNNINNQKHQKIGTKNIINRNNIINLGKFTMINTKYNNNEILSKYYGYFKKMNKK